MYACKRLFLSIPTTVFFFVVVVGAGVGGLALWEGGKEKEERPSFSISAPAAAGA